MYKNKKTNVLSFDGSMKSNEIMGFTLSNTKSLWDTLGNCVFVL